MFGAARILRAGGVSSPPLMVYLPRFGALDALSYASSSLDSDCRDRVLCLRATGATVPYGDDLDARA